MSLYRKENNLRKAQARLDKVSKRSKQFQIDFRREQNSRGRFHTRAYIVRGEKEHHSSRGILHKAVGLKYRVKGDKPSVTRFINNREPKSTTGKAIKTISGRELHEALGIKTQYSKWFARMCEYGFAENTDFIAVSQKRLTAQGNETTFTDHRCTADNISIAP